MRVLFWNTHKNKQINPVLLDLIKENEITFVLNVMQELIRINQIQKAALVEFDSIEGAKDETT